MLSSPEDEADRKNKGSLTGKQVGLSEEGAKRIS
jgi:hypothetical protein